MTEWCVLCSSVAEDEIASCGYCRFCGDCLKEYRNSKEILFCLCQNPQPLIKEILSRKPTLREVYEKVESLKESHREANDLLEKTESILSTSVIKAEIILALNYRFNYLPLETHDRICERLLKDYKKCNSTYFKGLEEVNITARSAVDFYSRLIQNFDVVQSLAIDIEKINQWYGKAESYNVNILETKRFFETLSLTHKFFYYNEMSYPNLDHIGFIGKIYDQKTKTGIKSNTGHLSSWKDGKLHGRKQIFSRDIITDEYYEDGLLKTRVELSSVSDGTQRTKITHHVSKQSKYVYYKETGDYIEIEQLNQDDDREGYCFYRRSSEKRSGIYFKDLLMTSIDFISENQSSS